VEAVGFDAGACAREGRRENDRIAKSQRIGSMRFGRIDVDPLMASEGRGVKPSTVSKQRVVAEMGNGRFQVQASGNGNGDDFVVVRSEDGRELPDTLGVAPPGEADKKFAADAEDVATFESARERNAFDLSKLGERVGQGRGFGTAGRRS
jgi:hypothetical protein